MNILKRSIAFVLLLFANTCFALVVHLPEEITQKTMAPILKEMREDRNKEELYVYTDSIGGELYQMQLFLEEMIKYKHKHTIVEKSSASAAAIITTFGDEVVIKRGAEVLFHKANCGRYEDSRDYRECMKTIDDFNKEFKGQYLIWGFKGASIEIMFEIKADIILKFKDGLMTSGQGLVTVTNEISEQLLPLAKARPGYSGYLFEI